MSDTAVAEAVQEAPQTEATPTAPTPEKVYFYKEILSNAYVVNGKAVPFEALSGNRGVIALDPENDMALVSALNNAASRHVGGIVKISAVQYTQKKTLHPFNPFALKLKQKGNMLKPAATKLFTRQHASAPAAAAKPATATAPAPATATPAPPAARTVTSPHFRPATRRIARDAHGIPVPPAPPAPVAK